MHGYQWPRDCIPRENKQDEEHKVHHRNKAWKVIIVSRPINITNNDNILLKYTEKTRLLMSKLNQIQDMTQKYWEEYSLDSYNMLSHSAVNNINKRKLTSWFKNLLIMATKLILTNFNERKASRQPTPSENTDSTQFVVLPWVPGLSPKLLALLFL